jgi:hypothetical protein
MDIGSELRVIEVEEIDLDVSIPTVDEPEEVALPAREDV